MPQMLFPASPAEPAVTRSTSKAGAGNSGKPEESRFDELTRAEQKRMERRQVSEEPAEAQEGSAGMETSAQNSGEPATSDSAEESAEPESGYVPVTFAALQPVPDGESRGPAPGQSVAASALSLSLVSPGTARQYLDAALQQMAEGGADSAAVRLSELTDPVPRQQGLAGGSRQLADSALSLRGYTTSVELPVGHARWGDQVIGKLTWLTARNLSEAEIHLTPPDMGPLEVKVRVHHDQASITVHAANPVVRDQLELHSHRLRDMLEQQGLSLQHFDVSGQSGNQTGGGEQAEEGGSPAPAKASVAASEEAEGALISGSLDLGWKGEVDVFA